MLCGGIFFGGQFLQPVTLDAFRTFIAKVASLQRQQQQERDFVSSATLLRCITLSRPILAKFLWLSQYLWPIRMRVGVVCFA